VDTDGSESVTEDELKQFLTKAGVQADTKIIIKSAQQQDSCDLESPKTEISILLRLVAITV
jgi:hypothetical protein